jgi:large subunit ribosomal protein L15
MAALTSAMAVSTPALLQKSAGVSSNVLQNSFLSGGVAMRRAAGNVGAVRVARKGLGVVAMARKPPVVEKDESEVDQRFRLNNLSPQPGSRHRQKRKGRGIAAGQGASCGFGMRGQQSRSGSGVRPGFEGGQTPLYRRLPKLRGIAGGMGAGLPKYVAVNLTDIAASFQEGEEVSLEALKERRVLNPSGRDRKLPLKILADGELDFKVKIKAGAVSAAAKEKLESLGCEFEMLPKKKKWVSAQFLKNQARADAYFAKKRGESA